MRWPGVPFFARRVGRRLPAAAAAGVVCAAAGLVAWPWAGPAVPWHDLADATNHLVRLYVVAAALARGEWYPRWLPELYLGYGYPLLNFYAPATYYLGAALHQLGLSVYASLQWAGALGVGLGAAGAFALARAAVPGRVDAALFAAAAFVLAPYPFLTNLYVRGNVPEALGVGLLPWLLLCARGAWYYGGRWSAAQALVLAALALTHNHTALLGVGLLAGWLLALAWLADVPPRRGAGRAVPAAAWGLGLSAFFWLPALAEARHVRLDLAQGGIYDFRLWLFDPLAIRGAAHADGVHTPFGPTDLGLIFDYGALNRHVPVRGSLGPALVWAFGGAVGALAVLGASRAGARPSAGAVRTTRLALASAALAAVCWFLNTTWSAPLWVHAPLLRLVQFPWRLYGPMALCVALAGAAGLALLPLRGHPGRAANRASKRGTDDRRPTTDDRADNGAVVGRPGPSDRPRPSDRWRAWGPRSRASDQWRRGNPGGDAPAARTHGRAGDPGRGPRPAVVAHFWAGRAAALALCLVLGYGSLAGRPFRAVAEPAHDVDQRTLVAEEYNRFGAGTTSGGEFLPRTVGWEQYATGVREGLRLYDLAHPEAGWQAGLVRVLDGRAAATAIYRLPRRIVADVEAETAALLGFHQLLYPAWRAYVDGQRVAAAPATHRRPAPDPPHEMLHASLGFIVVDVPAGLHRVEVVFAPTPERLAGIALTAGALAFPAAWWLLRTERTRRVRQWALPAAAGAAGAAAAAAAALALGEARPLAPLAAPPPAAAAVALDVAGAFARPAAAAPGGGAPAPRLVDVRYVRVDGEDRRWLYMHPPGEAAVQLRVPGHALFQAGLALDPQAWFTDFGDGVRFIVEVEAPSGRYTLLDRHVNPRARSEERRWIDTWVSLEAFAGQDVRLILRTDAAQDVAYDWAGWANPQVVVWRSLRPHPGVPHKF